MPSTLSGSAVLDKSSYIVGSTITLIVDWSDSDVTSMTVTATITDSVGNTVTTTPIATTIVTPVTVSAAVKDTGNRVWTQTASTQTSATFTTTA